MLLCTLVPICYSTIIYQETVGIKKRHMEHAKGSLIVLDTIDGGGKATQTKLLLARLAREAPEREAVFLDFPRYATPVGKVIRRYLSGEFGALAATPPRFASLAYSIDRHLTAEDIRGALARGAICVANRYKSSNHAYQAAKLPPDERDAFHAWLDDVEFRDLGVPEEDLLILLNIPVADASRLVRGRNTPDIHEADLGYQHAVLTEYLRLAAQKPHWKVVECVQDGALLPPEAIHERVWEVVSNHLHSPPSEGRG